MADRYEFTVVDGRDLPSDLHSSDSRYPEPTPEQLDYLASLIQSHPVVRAPRD